MREKRESPSLVAMRARGALLAMCERTGALVARIGILRARSPPPLPRILSSQAGEPSTHGLISEIEAGLRC